ncbi:MAG: hypothetical protein JEZ02_17240 [Desulfatibacillum sp.]|nr:hypothetical protein [Desulfatibacillum sp.]
MPKISLKGLAKYMTSGAVKQRKILKDYKYPNPEGQAQAAYYRDAKKYITEFHKDGRDVEWLTKKASQLQGLSQGAVQQRAVRLKHNARAIKKYARFFSGRDFSILDRISLRVAYAGVFITVSPDLHVMERKREKVILLDFSKDEPEEQTVKIISQAMFQAQLEAGMGLTSTSVLYFDVSRGQEHRGARAGARMLREIEAACENIYAIWDGI